MHPPSNDNDDNIIDISEIRKRQRTLGNAVRKNSKKKAAPRGNSPTFWTYVQVFIMLALVAYLMQLCQGG